MPDQRALVDLLRVESTLLHVTTDRPGRVDQLRTGAVVERERERHRRVVPRHRFGLFDAAPHPVRDAAPAPADEADAHAFLVQLVAARHQEALVEVHEEADLVERPAPVLGREREHRHPRQADVEAAFDRVEECLLPRRVAVGALQPALLRPPPVAVHDDRDVLRPVRLDRVAA